MIGPPFTTPFHSTKSDSCHRAQRHFLQPRMAEDERSTLLPPLPRHPVALTSLKSPLCPYAVDLEVSPPARRRRPPNEFVSKKPSLLPSRRHNQSEQPQPQAKSLLSISVAPGENSQGLASSRQTVQAVGRNKNNAVGGDGTVSKPDSNPGAGQSEKPIDEDSLILTIKSAIFLRPDSLKNTGYWTLNVLTAGLLGLLCRWYPTLLRKLRYATVDALDPRAELVLITSLDDFESYTAILALDLTDLTQGWQPVGHVRQRVTRRHRGDQRAGQQAVEASPRMFFWRHERFWFHPGESQGQSRGAGPWLRRAFDLSQSYREMHRISAERLEESLVDDVALDAAFARLLTYGENQLDVNIPPFPSLILQELLKPFFAFQLFSIIIWILQEYYIYMYVVVALSVISIIQSAYAEYQNLKALERLAKADGIINKIRLYASGRGMHASRSSDEDLLPSRSPGAAHAGGKLFACLTADPVATSSLQPGDVVHISTNMILPCDVLLLAGSVVMSEAMLTGESAPVLKSALPLDAPDTGFKPDSDRDRRYILFGGTKVLQAKCGNVPPVPSEDLAADGVRCLWDFGVPGPAASDHHSHHHHRHAGSITFEEMPAMGLVLRTGFSTARGQLIRAILFPKPSKFNFERQTFLFMRILLLVLGVGIAFQVAIYRRNRVDAFKTFLDSLNLVTVAVPPALPLALSVGVSVALARLKSYGIFCSDSSRISAAGRVNCLCFDKTGTLTTDGLTLKGVACVQQQQQQQYQSGDGNADRSDTRSAPGSKVLGGDLVTDVAKLHAVALEEGVRRAISRNNSSTCLSSKADENAVKGTGAAPPLSLSSAAMALPTAATNLFNEAAEPANNHKLMLSYVMAACHSISILDQTDDATALVLRLNSEIIADPSSLPERRQALERILEERGLLSTVEELVLDPDHDESILIKVEVEEEQEDGHEEEGGVASGHRRGLGRVSSSGGGVSGSGAGSSGRPYHPVNEEKEEEPLLDLPIAAYSDNVSDKTQHLVGDSLEILCFQESGWRYCVRPSEPPNLSELLRTMGPGALKRLFRDGAFDDFNIWRHPRLASYVDTVLLPPKSLKQTRHSSALAMVRRFDFDSDLRRMAAIVRTLPNLEPTGLSSAGNSRKRGGSASRFRYDQAGQHFLLVKGAPESIRDICNPATLPHDLEAQLQRLTLSGYRVLACGTRALEHLSEAELLRGTREELEKNLTFVGLLVMENALKEETTGYLRDYARAGLRQIMVTGDNPLTALAVSKMAGSAFLCAWRHPLLVDLGSGAGSREPRLAVVDVLDPTLQWDLQEYLQAYLGSALLTLNATKAAEIGKGIIDDRDSGGSSRDGSSQGDDRPRNSKDRIPSTTPALALAGNGGRKPPPALAAVDLVCTGRAFAALLAQHASFREEKDCDGEAWTPLEVVLLKCNVFARMSPHNKQELMRSLQELDYVVCMTGDGANDSGALKAADIGISIASATNVLLSEPGTAQKKGKVAPGESSARVLDGTMAKGKADEASEDEERQDDDNPENAKIATEISTAEAAVTAAPSIAAPFATGLHHIGAVCTVVTEGRGTLATSFSMFKYMFLYGIIQVRLSGNFSISGPGKGFVMQAMVLKQ